MFQIKICFHILLCTCLPWIISEVHPMNYIYDLCIDVPRCSLWSVNSTNKIIQWYVTRSTNEAVLRKIGKTITWTKLCTIKWSKVVKAQHNHVLISWNILFHVTFPRQKFRPIHHDNQYCANALHGSFYGTNNGLAIQFTPVVVIQLYLRWHDIHSL